MRKSNNSQNRLSIIISTAILLATLYLSSVVPFSTSSTQSSILSGAVDLDVTHTITQGPGLPPRHMTSEIVKGGMYVGFDAPARTLVPWTVNFTLHVRYVAGVAAVLVVAVGLKRNSSQHIYGETQFPNATQVALTINQDFTWEANWSENGVDQWVSADNAQTGTSHSGTIYDVGLETYPVNGEDTNTANNYALWGQWNASRLVGDVKPDGIVDIFDALILSGAYGTKPTSGLWNASADLKEDLVVDIFDAIILASNFNQHVP